MKTFKIVLLATVVSFIGVIFAVSAKDAPYKANKTYAFTNVNVIPMDKERVLRNRTAVVRNGIIAKISKSKKTPKGAIKIDGTGKYLTPGFIDMHTHLFSDYEFPDALAEDELKIMLANGVTTTRLMIGVPEHLELREKSAKGEILAPTIYAASPQFAGRRFGKIYNGYVVTNESQARESVRKAKQAGYDFIKLTFWITRPVYDAIIDEAKKQNIKVIGHVDANVGIERVFEAGQQIEHLDGFFEGLIPKDSPFKFSTSGVNVWNPKGWDSIDVLDEKLIPTLAKKSVKSNPYSVPTLTFLKLAFGTGQTDEDIKSRADYRFLPEKIRNQMAGPRNAFWNRGRTPSEKRRKKYVELRNKMVKALHDAGGKIMAGSDAPEWFLLYGFTLHRELESLAEAGLSNYAVLESTTRIPAEFFGALDKFGTVEKGKRADLVLLDSNPLANISNKKKIAGVMIKGNWMPKDKIDEMLDEITPKFQTAFDKKQTANKVEQFGKDVFADGKEIFRGTFSADGKTFYYFKKMKPQTEEYRIFKSNLVQGKWTKPKVLNLGGDFSDMYPAISKDGKRFVFSSYRPAPNDKSAKPNAHLWMVEKQKNGKWGKPVFLKNINELGHYHSWVEFGWDGNLYFRQTTPDWRGNKTMMARWNGKSFEKPNIFEEADRWKGWKRDVRVVGGSPGPKGKTIFLDVATQSPETKRWASDIWVSLKKNGKWQEPKPLGKNINKEGFDVFPFFSPDGKTMYFIRDFKTFHKISLKEAISSIHKNTAISIDGTLSDTEWEGAKTLELTGGGKAFYKFIDNEVYVGVRGVGAGWITIYATDGKDIYALHASAALGTAIYKNEKGVWKNSQGFKYVARDASMSAEAIKARDRFYKTNGWAANVGEMGKPNEREFKISDKFFDGNKMQIAIVYSAETKPISLQIYPKTLSDDALNMELIIGNTPSELKFNTSSWAIIEP